MYFSPATICLSNIAHDSSDIVLSCIYCFVNKNHTLYDPRIDNINKLIFDNDITLLRNRTLNSILS